MHDKKKQRRIPRHLVAIGHFKYAFPALNPDAYLDYLKRCPVDHLTFTTEDSNLQDHGTLPHTSFVFKKEKVRGHVWVSGTLYTTDHSDTTVVGNVGVRRSHVIGVVFVVPILGALIIPSALDNLVAFACACLYVFAIAYFSVWMPKRETLRLLENPD